MKNKKMIVNYCQCWGESGTHYTQQIKIDTKTMEKFNNYIKELKEESNKKFIYSDYDLKILNLKPLEKGVNFTNLIHLELFTQFYIKKLYIPPKKDKDFERILNRNTVIIVK